ncbi:hypothetical protein ACHQM5_029617 [Ranunculus cassubicifolius]
MIGNGVIGILAESTNKWERRAPLTPAHCARLLHSGRRRAENGVKRIIIQTSTKRIHHDSLYEDVGCEVSEDLLECGLILGIKQPKLEMILPDRAYAFFSHTHKAQKENMPLLDRRLLAFGKFAGRAGLIDFLHGLGKRYLSLGYSTPFLSIGASYMYTSLVSAKAAVIAVGEQIATQGLPSGICPLVFVFTGSGNVSQGAQEIFKLLPHSFVDSSRLPGLLEKTSASKRVFQVYGCIVTSKDMVEPKDATKKFDKADYYAHPEHYNPIFHERIAPYTSVIINCMYWEKRFPRLISTQQLQELMRKESRLIGISDITCDIGGSIEFINQSTPIENPFLRYDYLNDTYHHDMEGNGIICLAVDILPTEFAKEASQHFGDILTQFVGNLASSKNLSDLPSHLVRACIAHRGALTSLYEYIPRMIHSDIDDLVGNHASGHLEKRKYNVLVSLSGHLFDQFLINEALDIIEAAGGSFHLVSCQVGQSSSVMSYSELEVGADDRGVLDQIIDSLTSIANPSEDSEVFNRSTKRISLTLGKVSKSVAENGDKLKKGATVLILGAGRVCRPAAEFLASIGNISSRQWVKACFGDEVEETMDIQVIVASLYLKDAEETIEGIPNTTAIQLDVTDEKSLCQYISQVEGVISLLPPSCHIAIADVCIKLKKNLVTASYIDDSMSKLDEPAKEAGITILGEMGLDPGIDHMMAMNMINQAHVRGGKIKSFTSYCGGLPSPAAANNPLAYKFSWNPAGAIKAGRNPATYKSLGDIIHVDGDKLYDSASRCRIPHLPAFALECLPNRDSLIYGDLYGIGSEASTVFRGTLRYEGFGEIMGTLARIGLFDTEPYLFLEETKMPTFNDFLSEVLKIESETVGNEKEMIERLISLGVCKEKSTAEKTVKTIKFLGLHEKTEIPSSCKSAFDVTCFCMQEKLTYSDSEQDMVILHHEVEVEFPDNKRPVETHQATLLEFGKDKTTTAMALTVGIPAAIGALLLIGNKIQTKGVLRPLEPEVYVPALEILEAYGFKLSEKVE